MTTDRRGPARCRLVPDVGLTLHPRSLDIASKESAGIDLVLAGIGQVPAAATLGSPTGWPTALRPASEPLLDGMYTGLWWLFLDRLGGAAFADLQFVAVMLGADLRHAVDPEAFRREDLAKLGAGSPIRGIFPFDDDWRDRAPVWPSGGPGRGVTSDATARGIDRAPVRPDGAAVRRAAPRRDRFAWRHIGSLRAPLMPKCSDE